MASPETVDEGPDFLRANYETPASRSIVHQRKSVSPRFELPVHAKMAVGTAQSTCKIRFNFFFRARLLERRISGDQKWPPVPITRDCRVTVHVSRNSPRGTIYKNSDNRFHVVKE